MQTTPTALQGTPGKQLATCAFWLLRTERFDTAFQKLIDLRRKELNKVKPNRTTEESLLTGACATLHERDASVDHILKRGGLLFVGATGALRMARELEGSAA